MIKSIFIPQTQLEAWMGAGEATFADNVLTVPGRGIFQLDPAVRVTSLIDGHDARGWVGKTLTVKDIEAAGGEYFQGTVICGDTGYECQDGFLGMSEGARTEPSTAVVAAASKPVGGDSVDVSERAGVQTDLETAPAESSQAADVDLLSDFLLKNLT